MTLIPVSVYFAVSEDEGRAVACALLHAPATGLWKAFTSTLDEGAPIPEPRADLAAALFALDRLRQPSNVTLVCPSDYVVKGLEETDDAPARSAFGDDLIPALWRKLDEAFHTHRLERATAAADHLLVRALTRDAQLLAYHPAGRRREELGRELREGLELTARLLSAVEAGLGLGEHGRLGGYDALRRILTETARPAPPA